MSSSDSTIKAAPLPPAVIQPGPDAEPPLNLTRLADGLKQKLSPTDRLEARADKHIEELQADKLRLEKEIHSLRTVVIAEYERTNQSLRGSLSEQSESLARLETSYSWATSFNVFSFICVTVGGGDRELRGVCRPGLFAGPEARGGPGAWFPDFRRSDPGSRVLLRQEIPPTKKVRHTLRSAS